MARRNMRTEARRCAQRYWLDLCDDIQKAADMGHTRRMYEGIKRCIGPIRRAAALLKDPKETLCNLFTKNSACSSRSLRNTETDLRLPKKRSANGQKCFSFRGAKLWNSIPAESKKASSLGGFKNQYRVEHFPFSFIQ